MVDGLSSHHSAQQRLQILAQVAASLRLQHSLSQVPTSTTQMATTSRLLCSSYQVIPSLEQQLTLAFTQAPSKRTQIQQNKWPFQTTPKPQPTTPKQTNVNSGLSWHLSPAKVNHTLWGQPLHNNSFTIAPNSHSQSA